jgi:hypothetical protein
MVDKSWGAKLLSTVVRESPTSYIDCTSVYLVVGACISFVPSLPLPEYSLEEAEATRLVVAVYRYTNAISLLGGTTQEKTDEGFINEGEGSRAGIDIPLAVSLDI